MIPCFLLHNVPNSTAFEKEKTHFKKRSMKPIEGIISSNIEASAVNITEDDCDTRSIPVQPLVDTDANDLVNRVVHQQTLLEYTEDEAPSSLKVYAATGLACTSISIQMVLKAVLTEWNFGSVLFVAGAQQVCTLVVLLYRRNVSKTAPPFPVSSSQIALHTLQTIFPLQFVFFLNTVSGLIATGSLTLPNFVMLRRMSLLMTMMLEAVILNRKPSRLSIISVMLMLTGALVAAGFESNLSMRGGIYVLINNVFTSLQTVVLRKKMNDVSLLVTTEGIMFYNNIFALISTVILLLLCDWETLRSFAYWNSPLFLFALFLTSVLGFVINYFNFLSTKVNSPLTTSVVGGSKNIISFYLGMLFHDYTATWSSILGMNMSAIGTVVYSTAEWKRMQQTWEPRTRSIALDHTGLSSHAHEGDIISP